MRPIGPHQIRHLIASSLLDAGYGVHEIAERLGHDPATLMRYYTRVSASRRLQATDRIAELMTLPQGETGPLQNRPDEISQASFPRSAKPAESRERGGRESVYQGSSDHRCDRGRR